MGIDINGEIYPLDKLDYLRLEDILLEERMKDIPEEISPDAGLDTLRRFSNANENTRRSRQIENATLQPTSTNKENK